MEAALDSRLMGVDFNVLRYPAIFVSTMQR